MKSATRRSDASKITEPTMSKSPQRGSLLRSALVFGLMLMGLCFAVAAHVDSSHGGLHDEGGIIEG